MPRIVKARCIIIMLIAASVTAPHGMAAGWLALDKQPQLAREAALPFERVAVVDSPKRHTFDDYAKLKGVPAATIVKRYAGTVVIRCNGHQATAQITGAQDIITTAAHPFFDRETCRQTATADSCEITVKTPSAQTKYKGFEMVDYGYRKSIPTDGSCPMDGLPWGDDWAVLRLRNKKAISALAREIKPYKLPAPGEAIQKLDEPVVAVSGAALDFFDFTPEGTKFYPRNIQDCVLRDVAAAMTYVETDCDTAELSSGGSLLKRDKRGDTLIGIHMGSFETKEELTEALVEKRTNTRRYRRGHWSALYVSVDGEFLRALERVVHPD